MTMMNVSRVLFLFLSFITLVNGQQQQQPSDMDTMKTFKDSLKLPNNLWSETDPCSWKGIQCVGNRITRIQIGKLNISGTLPNDLRSLTSLTTFEVMSNSLTGSIPNISGLRSLQTFDVSSNSFTLAPPQGFFNGLTSLQEVRLHDNPFDSWEIPSSLKDASSLVEFSAGNSNLSGNIPDFLGGLTFPSLTVLSLFRNSLFGELPASFSGSSIRILYLNGQKGNDKLNGSIAVLENMTSLTDLSLQGNGFSGPIPDLSRLVSLERFNVRENQLTGEVSDTFTELQSLKVVNLTNNLLQGPIPIFKSKDIAVDVKPINSFCLDTPGTPCDPRVNTLLSIVEAFGYPVRFAESWKGNDPCNGMWLGITCFGGDVTVLNFKNMGLTGFISPRFSDFTSLQVINLSNNNLTGIIPQELTKLSSLRTLDVSNNRLYGKVPDFKPNVVVTNGNPDIGKDGPRPANGSSSSGNKSKKIAGSIVGIVIGLVLIGFAVFFFVRRQNRKPHCRNSDQDGVKITIGNLSGCVGSESSSNDGYGMFSIQVLRDATDNFAERNILGRGGFGIVYKGELRDGTKIAVKRMGHSVISGKGLDEFKSEIAVLTKVRHRNLVALHGYCLEGDERLLVYEYIPQGTLSRHIFEWREEGLKPLEWTSRLVIAVDVAKAVEYLHTLAQQSFIHRDLKPSNILIGDDMHAKVADFGLVRLAPEGTMSVETKIAGTFGYLAPEYAVTGRVTTKIDVYSFGVILMELLTGRKALDAKRSEEDVHLPTWFRRMLINKESFSKAIDETIEVNDDQEILQSINIVAELASHCSAREPQQRPNMSHVVNVLVSLLERFRPADERCLGSEDIYGIDYDTPLPQVSHGLLDHSLASTTSRPRGFDRTFGQGR